MCTIGVTLGFPDNCIFYHGPHSSHCLASIWLNSGCLEDGLGYPLGVSFSEYETMQYQDLP